MLRTHLIPETETPSVREKLSSDNGLHNGNECYINKEYLIDSSQHILEEKEITTMTGAKSETKNNSCHEKI